MFHLYHSNKLAVLKSILAHLIKTDPQPNPFANEQILVQSPGMAQWLKIELAKELSICANITFPLPASFIWQTFVNVLGDVPERSAFNKDAMAWHIIARLPLHIQRPEFSELAQYLEDDEPLKTYQLAYKIADIYDQYLVYRPHWIEAWQQGSVEFSDDQPWQAILWQDLAQTIIASGQSHYHRANLYEHLIAALKQPDVVTKLPQRIFVFGISALPPKYLEALQAISAHCEVHFFLNNPCQVYWGDILDAKWLQKLANQQRAAYPLAQLDESGHSVAQRALLSQNGIIHSSNSQDSEAQFNEKGELMIGNPLLASLGKLGRDNLALMVELNAQEVEVFIEAESPSLLGQINNDILHLQDPTFIAQTKEQLTAIDNRKTIADDDHSIIIHQCHSPMREVEILHDQLLAMFAADDSLTPKDIVVMMPDVNAYSPYIQAVFSQSKYHKSAGEQGGQSQFDNPHQHKRIDFSISDRSAEQENPIILSFLTLLQLPHTRQSSNELFALLEVPAIMENFGLTPQSLETLKLWIDESGIRHGLDNTQSNSWQFGLNRMFKGYSQIEQGQSLWADILAYPESCGLAAEELGQLAQFVEFVEYYTQALPQPQSFEQWKGLLDTLIEQFYLSTVEYDQELQLIRDCIKAFGEELAMAHYNDAISHEVLFEHLVSKLNQGQSSQRFLAGKLNFCTLMPMRSIPFKVVCLLGMNDGTYPRTIAPLGFDLMANDSQKGDRSRRDDDRYLFLEAMLSAQQQLYISYCGRSIKDNSERCPSVLIDELTDYISQSYRLESLPEVKAGEEATLEECSEQMLAHLMVEHPLTPFSAPYFTNAADSSNSLFTYQQDWLAALTSEVAQQPFMSEPLPWVNENPVIELDQLKRFFKQPCQYFLNQRLGIYFGQHDVELQDSEPFNPNGLESYLVKAQLLQGYLSNQELSVINQLRAEGILPHGHFADLYLEQQTDTMFELAASVKPYLMTPNDDVEVNLSLNTCEGEMTLQGWLKQHMSPCGLVRYKSGKANAKFFIECYLDYLCYSACRPNSEQLPEQLSEQSSVQLSGQSYDVLMFAQDGQWRFSAMESEQAIKHLERLTNFFIGGQCSPQVWFIQSAWDYINVLFEERSLSLTDDEKSVAKAHKALLSRFEGGFMMTGEGQDPYIARCFEQLDEQTISELITNAIDILLPLRQQLEELDGE
ncbi:exodeoxyribonuclease V subunit gamma [Psychrobium sp. 1_MG-2023]|uniref:exodeoxyribonuclease V subunit gamma n=1 Tax=Psychrobium sp. 1_MG-2023 TaxID=3062624 RepID=UPI00267BE0BC|nr:exodeoxyribonuclease V subunit gamma [Psychrobium sp. 1_MG-2023]MDP2562351.1 exodeoxyribonuclease V subunit gamma [Psychrobium sp. 1_MG-2023]